MPDGTGPGSTRHPARPSMADRRWERYTHGHHESVLRSHVWRTAENSCAYLLPHLRTADRILDVGCGPGTITVDLARHVSAGHVLGVDRSADVVERARCDAADAEVGNVTFAGGDVYALGDVDLDELDGAPSVVHAHQVLQHLASPVEALRGMASVLEEQGLIAVRDADYSAMVWHPHVPELTRWREIYLEVARHNGGEPDAGRQLLGWALSAGLDVVHASAATWCFATAQDRRWWGDLWADRVTGSDLARQAVELGAADHDELVAIGEGWRAWATAPDGWFTVVHGEVIARAPVPRTTVGYGQTNKDPGAARDLEA
jgi:SAM-dependent methyltransferase